MTNHIPLRLNLVLQGDLDPLELANLGSGVLILLNQLPALVVVHLILLVELDLVRLSHFVNALRLLNDLLLESLTLLAQE